MSPRTSNSSNCSNNNSIVHHIDFCHNNPGYMLLGIIVLFLSTSFLLVTQLDNIESVHSSYYYNNKLDKNLDYFVYQEHNHLDPRGDRGHGRGRGRGVRKDGAGDRDKDDSAERSNEGKKSPEQTVIEAFQRDDRTFKMRKEFEKKYPPNDSNRIRNYVHETLRLHPILNKKEYETLNINQPKDLSYDIRYNCPYEPPKNYPIAWNVIDVLKNWNVDDTSIPPATSIYNGLCIFDYTNDTQRHTANHYRELELPFVIHNHPQVLRTSERWMRQTEPKAFSNQTKQQPNEEGENRMLPSTYLEPLLGTEAVRNEYSQSNHLMFYRITPKVKQIMKESTILDQKEKKWTPPIDNVKLTYAEWFKKAQQLEQKVKKATNQQTQNSSKTFPQSNYEHYYFRLNGDHRQHIFLYNELEFFNPYYENVLQVTQAENSRKAKEEIEYNNLFHIDRDDHRGINCRFGMKGNIAEAHFDFSRNFIVLLGGLRRYILAHPNQCKAMELYDDSHPSARHSKINWSTVVFDYETISNGEDDKEDEEGLNSSFTEEEKESITNFAENLMVNEVVLQAGDVLYLPTAWFHFIVSLNINYQCNSRSGVSDEYHDDITECGQKGEKASREKRQGKKHKEKKWF